MIRSVCLLVSISAAITAAAEDPSSLRKSLIFRASFDGSADAGIAKGDGRLYTAESIAMKDVRPGIHVSEVSIAADAGRFGDALRFSAKTPQVLFYKVADNGFRPRGDWSGTFSFWMKLSPDDDLPEGYCDPVQITSKTWNDAAFFVDFDRDLPRDFRLGVFSDYKFWNPKDISWDDWPVERRPMIVVRKPPFSRDKWTHVAFTFHDVNSSTGADSTASLYLNGQLQGTLKQPLRFTWEPSGDGQKEAVMMLGINYVGDIDEVALFNHALSSDDVKTLYELPDGL
ncbi:MAG: LamG domain-containing protein [Planctomycetaceae bacterium]